MLSVRKIPVYLWVLIWWGEGVNPISQAIVFFPNPISKTIFGINPYPTESSNEEKWVKYAISGGGTTLEGHITFMTPPPSPPPTYNPYNHMGYWPSLFGQDGWILAKYFFLCKLLKKEPYPAILTEQTWSIKDLLFGIWGHFSYGIQRVVPGRQDGALG